MRLAADPLKKPSPVTVSNAAARAAVAGGSVGSHSATPKSSPSPPFARASFREPGPGSPRLWVGAPTTSGSTPAGSGRSAAGFGTWHTKC
jgi:hypothetical protein